MTPTPTPARPALDAMAEEIERLSNLATEGPWDCWDMDEFDYHVFEARRGLSQDCRKSLMAVRWGRSHPEGPNVPRQRDPGRAANFNEMAANAELVCILRNNAPALVAALRSLADMRGALQEIEATDWFWASAPHGGPNVKVAGPQAKRARAALARSAP